MESKWSELLEGGGASAAGAAPAVPQASEASSFSGWVVLVPLMAVVIIALVVASTGGSKARATDKAIEKVAVEPLNVVQAVASPDVPLKVPVADAPLGARVGVRNTARSLFATEDSLNHIEQPFGDAEGGYTYTDFQAAMEYGREKPVYDKPNKANAAIIGAQIDSMKSYIKRNGFTLDDFADARDVALPDSIAESWDTEYQQPPERQQQDMRPETLVLAQEALQAVPTKATAAAIVPVLREILAARTEAATSQIELPPLTDDQRDGLQHWSAVGGVAGSLANTILSRVQ